MAELLKIAGEVLVTEHLVNKANNTGFRIVSVLTNNQVEDFRIADSVEDLSYGRYVLTVALGLPGDAVTDIDGNPIMQDAIDSNGKVMLDDNKKPIQEQVVRRVASKKIIKALAY